jgi:hypothetical protein
LRVELDGAASFGWSRVIGSCCEPSVAVEFPTGFANSLRGPCGFAGTIFGAGRFHRGMRVGIETPILRQLPFLVFGVVRGYAAPRAGGFAPMDRSPSGSVMLNF